MGHTAVAVMLLFLALSILICYYELHSLVTFTHIVVVCKKTITVLLKCELYVNPEYPPPGSDLEIGHKPAVGIHVY